MKWYLASRTWHKEMVKSIGKILESHNHELSFDWTKLDKITSYDKNPCKDISEKISSAISDTDVFVLISDPEGTDMFIELGIAINSFLENKKPNQYKWKPCKYNE